MTRPYHVHIEPTAHKERKTLPGHVRQRVKRLIDQLAHEPRPHHSKALDTTGIEIPEHVELRRIRLEKWRIIYATASQRALGLDSVEKQLVHEPVTITRNRKPVKL